MLYTWVKKYRKNQVRPFVGSGHIKQEDEIYKKLLKEIRELREENEILKKAASLLREKPKVDRYRFIKAESKNYRVTKLCEILLVKRSSYYACYKRLESKRSIRKKVLTKQVKKEFFDNKMIPGAIKIAKKLNTEQSQVCKKLVSKIMKENGLISKVVKKYKATTNS